MNERVRVVVRIRPFMESDAADANLTTLFVDSTHVSVGNDRIFSVDRVYRMEDSAENIFDDVVHPMISDFLSGFNVTVMAYGQTGSGKTFTMSGLIPLALQHIVNTGFNGSTNKLSFQFIEVYGDVLRDLLSEDPVASAKTLHLYESGSGSNEGETANNGAGSCTLVGAFRATARSLKEIHEIMQYGYRMRATGATNVHEHSSRSHSIFTVFNHERGGNKLHFVDLAGSERNKKTLNVGKRFQESIGINTGLLALGNVIRALLRNHQQNLTENSGHVPYRSSKLTRLLQDALGGDSKTLFLACVAPDSYNRAETLHTLQYCALALRVLNAPLRHYQELQDAQMRPFRLLHRYVEEPLDAKGEVSRAAKKTRRGGTRMDGEIAEAASENAKTAVPASFETSSNCDIYEELELYKQFCLEQEAEIIAMRERLSIAEERARVLEDELRQDKAIFANNISEIEHMVKENHMLRQRAAQHERGGDPPKKPTMAHAEARGGKLNSLKRDSLGEPCRNALANGGRERPRWFHTQNFQGSGTGTNIERHNFEDTDQLRQTMPFFEVPAFPSPADLTHDAQPHYSLLLPEKTGLFSGMSTSLSSGLCPASKVSTWDRDEQLQALTKAALFYQTDNTELRSQLSSLKTILETQQRDSALMRLELQEIHELMLLKKTADTETKRS